MTFAFPSFEQINTVIIKYITKSEMRSLSSYVQCHVFDVQYIYKWITMARLDLQKPSFCTPGWRDTAWNDVSSTMKQRSDRVRYQNPNIHILSPRLSPQTTTPL